MLRRVVVAEGCIRGNIGELKRLAETAERVSGPLFRVTIMFRVVPNLGCGSLVAVLGPRGGIRGLLFNTSDHAIPVGRAELANFKPTTIHDEALWARIKRKYLKTQR